MKTKLLGLALAIICSQAVAQVGALYDAEVVEMSSITDPAKAASSAEGHWLAFSLPVLEGTRSPCCWQGKWSGMGDVGCSLEPGHESFGTRSDTPLTDYVIVYNKIRDGQVGVIRVVGEQCPMDAKGARITWIGSVDEAAGLDWLEIAARSEGRDSDGGTALYALAMHRSTDAGQRLYSLAREPGEDRSGEAVFWLATEHPDRAEGWLLEVLNTEQDEDVLEQAVFAISQLPDGKGDKILLDLAQDGKAPKIVRRQALFWLANSDNESSVAALAELLTR